MKKLVFIINPIAGGVRKEKVVAAIGKYIDKSRFMTEIRYTEYAGHATALADSAVKEGADIVVAVGGDGSVNEVAKALLGTSAALGIIPCGSGNGLARHLCIPMNLKSAIELINADFVTVADSASLNGIPFFCTAGIGYDARVCSEYTKAGTRGLATYVEKSIAEYFTYKPRWYRIKTEKEEIIRRAFVITFANANQWGNNFHVAPHASVKDGMMDLVIIHPIQLLHAIIMPSQILGYRFDRNPDVEIIRCTRAEVFCLPEVPGKEDKRGASPGMEAHFDGEPWVSGPELSVKIHPESLRVVVPETELSRI